MYQMTKNTHLMTHLAAEAVGGCDGVEGDGGELCVVMLGHHQRGGVSRGRSELGVSIEWQS